MLQIKRGESNATLRRILIALVNADGEDVSGVTLAAGELKLSKAGGAEANALGTLTECNGAGLGRGLYYYDPTVAEVNTYGELVGTIIKTGIRTYRFRAMIVADSPYSNAEYALIEEGTPQAVTAGAVTLDATSTLQAGSVPFAIYFDAATNGKNQFRFITSLDTSVAGAFVATISPNFGVVPTGGPAMHYQVFAVPPLPSNGEVIAIKTVTDKLDTALALSAGAYRFTAPSLALAPSGTGASAADIRAEMDASSTRLAAIDAKTAQLPAAPAGVPDIPTEAEILTAFKADTDWKTMLADANGDWTMTHPATYPGVGTLTLKDKAGLVTLATLALSFDAAGRILSRAST